MQIPQEAEFPTYSLFINPRDLQELRRDIWCDDPLPAKLKIGKTQYDVDIAYRGSHIRTLPKKSYHISFIKPATFAGAREIHLNGEYIDPSMIRNKLSLDFFRSIGTLSPDARFVLLKVNGAFHGVYLQLESVDDLFFKKRKLPVGSIYYAVDDDANFSLISPFDDDAKKSLESGYERKHGTDSDDAHLREFIYKINTLSQTEFEREIVNYVAVDQYLRWLIGVVCTQNFDAFIQNYALYRNSETGLFEIIPWDYDATWGRDCNAKIMEYDYIPITGYNTLTARLLSVPKFRLRYCDLLTEVLETEFTPEALAPKVVSLHKSLRPHLMLDPYKKQDINKFDAELKLILQYIEDRSRYLRDHITDLVP